MADPPSGTPKGEAAEVSGPQGASEASEASGPQGASEASYRQTLATAGRLAQANPGADPSFRLRLEKRLRERARAELPGLARRSRVREELATALRVGAGAVLVIAFVLALSFIFKSVKPWGAGSQNTPTSELPPTSNVISTVLVGPTVLVQQVTTPTAIPLIPPTPVPGNPLPTPSTTTLPVTQSSNGSWTTYTDPAWQQNGESILVSDITVAPDGAVWAGTLGGAVSIGTGVYRFDRGNWTRFTDQDGIPFMEVDAIAAAPDGSLWFATECCGLSRFDGKRWTTYTTGSGLPTNDIRALVIGPDGALWLGTEDKGVVRFDGKGWQNFTMERDGLWGNMVTHGFLMPDGSLLFSTSTTWPYLSRFDGQTWSQYAPPGGPVGVYTADIATASDGSIWFATSEGVFRLKDGAWTNFTTQDGLASNQVFRVVAAPGNVLWFGTDSGLSRFDGSRWTTFTTRDGLASDWISSLAMAPDGTLWVGTAGGISRGSPALSSPAPSATPAVPLNLQSSHNDIRALMYNPTWCTLWIQGQASTYSSVGVQENTYMQAWISRDGTGRVLATGSIPGSLNFNLDMDVSDIWVSDGKTITSLDKQSGQPASIAAGIMHPLDRANPVLGVIFPAYLAVRSEDLQVVKMDEQAGRLALVATWASYRIWIDTQTGLILRSQTLDQNGQVTSDTQVQAILVDGAIPDGELSTEGLDQARFERSPAGASTDSYTPGPESTPMVIVTANIVYSANTANGAELFVMVGQDGQDSTQLTHDSAINTGPACAVDGSLIAFTGIRDNQHHIFLIQPDGSGERRLTDSPFDEADPAFSPNGQKIAFVSTRDGNPEIYVMALDGSGLIRLTDNPAEDAAPAWSPDGKQIVFTSSRDSHAQIYVMNADGTGQTNLSNSPASDFEPAWSPDGKKIAFWSSQRGKGTQEVIYVMTRDGQDVTPLTGEPQGVQVFRNFGPAWSPDGRWMAFYSYRDGIPSAIFSMVANGSGQIGLEIQLTPRTMVASGRPCWLAATTSLSGAQPTLAIPTPAGTQSPAVTPISIFALPAWPRLLRRMKH
jgi:TolB protein